MLTRLQLRQQQTVYIHFFQLRTGFQEVVEVFDESMSLRDLFIHHCQRALAGEFGDPLVVAALNFREQHWYDRANLQTMVDYPRSVLFRSYPWAAHVERDRMDHHTRHWLHHYLYADSSEVVSATQSIQQLIQQRRLPRRAVRPIYTVLVYQYGQL